jgi:hypothetical protein
VSSSVYLSNKLYVRQSIVTANTYLFEQLSLMKMAPENLQNGATLDAEGLKCPLPVLRARKAIKALCWQPIQRRRKTSKRSASRQGMNWSQAPNPTVFLRLCSGAAVRRQSSFYPFKSKLDNKRHKGCRYGPFENETDIIQTDTGQYWLTITSCTY